MKYILMAFFVICITLTTTKVAQSENSSNAVIATVADTKVQKPKPDVNQYIGAGAGAAIGYGLGRIIGKTAGIIGGGLGAVIGSASTDDYPAWAIVVRFKNGTHSTIIQRKDMFPNVVYKEGDYVTVANLNGSFVVIKDGR